MALKVGCNSRLDVGYNSGSDFIDFGLPNGSQNGAKNLSKKRSRRRLGSGRPPGSHFVDNFLKNKNKFLDTCFFIFCSFPTCENVLPFTRQCASHQKSCFVLLVLFPVLKNMQKKVSAYGLLLAKNFRVLHFFYKEFPLQTRNTSHAICVEKKVHFVCCSL